MRQGTQLTVTGYVRVSQVGMRRAPRFISPEVQREAIERWVRTHRARLTDVLVELDESGARGDRPKLGQALELIETGASQGLIVYRVARFSRSLADGVAIIKRVTANGGEFYSADDGFDTSTRSGRLMLHVLLSLAESDIEIVRDGFEVAHLKATARGAYQGAYTPLGYRLTRAAKLRPDPRTASIVTELFQRRARGESVASLCRWLEQQHVLTPKGNPGWKDGTLRYQFTRRVYLGEISWNGHVHEGAHPPLTDPDTWHDAQQPRQRSIDWSPRPSLLSGLVRCASCSMVMSPIRSTSRHPEIVNHYRCRAISAGGACPAPASITTQYLEPYVEIAILEVLRRRRRAPQAALEAAQHTLDRAERDLAKYRDSPRVLHVLGEMDFAAGLQIRADRARDARAHLAAVRARSRLHALPPTEHIEAHWADMPIRARHEIIRAVLDCVFVKPGRLDVEERVIVCPHGTAPTRLPRAGDNHSRARPYTPPKSLPTATAQRSAYLWSRTRIERELRQFLRGRNRWPSRDEFHAAGYRRLQTNVVLGDGEHYWALRTHTPIDNHDAVAPWTERRIRETLVLYLADKHSWPTFAQFSRDGMQSLRYALIETGGVRAWQNLFPHPAERRNDRRESGWDEGQIRTELTSLLAGRARFPTRREFADANQERLYSALIRHGGVSQWAREFELPTARPRDEPPSGRRP
ncbi:DNA invertase Pin-like site-specific DNA recombinase [Solirubrobacter pauli]|uniref:DNA invertase Pin-like site-specific DNA recombinase n=1 Tax=Solirubrobacter pauli TaxID=166793 RepID=A0A660L7J9_9ACTN|nr:recombinase family protein [Solirubrobacter pauli]RKQ90469.1 DNA invertase Pin-like site-specific DNA recombinase [Solirubrobacter pauli]